MSWEVQAMRTSVGTDACHLVFPILRYCIALHDVTCCLPVLVTGLCPFETLVCVLIPHRVSQMLFGSWAEAAQSVH